MSEQQFIQQLKQQDAAACRTLVQQYGDKVFNTALGILQHHQNAEDIAQEVFAEIFQSIGQFKAGAKLSTWVYRITVNKCLEHLRAKNRKKRAAFLLPLFGMEDTLVQNESTAFYHPGVQAENKELSALLFKAISKLPEHQQVCFVLNKVEGLSYAEVAEVMNKQVPAIESLLVRAKQNLQKWLGDYYRQHVTG